MFSTARLDFDSRAVVVCFGIRRRGNPNQFRQKGRFAPNPDKPKIPKPVKPEPKSISGPSYKSFSDRITKARAVKGEFDVKYFERIGNMSSSEQLTLITRKTRYSKPRNLHFGISIEDVANKTVYFYTLKGTLYAKTEFKDSKA